MADETKFALERSLDDHGVLSHKGRLGVTAAGALALERNG
jgi:hypothetical protein